MNKQVGLYSSLTAAGCILLFFIGLITGQDKLSYASCLVLSWAYVLTVCSFVVYTGKDRQAAVFGSVSIAIIYSVFTNLTYYSQLTTVWHETADPAVISALTMSLGSWLFGFDIMGYGLMGLSTLLLGLSLKPVCRRDRIMKGMLIGHGIFFPICVIMPILNVFKAGGDETAGILALALWCVYFAPVMILAALHFWSKKDPVIV